MKESYSNYGLDDAFIRTFMMPAVMPSNLNNINSINMLNSTQMGMQGSNNLNVLNRDKLLSSNEGFLRGNMEASSYIPYKNMTYLRANISNERQRDLYRLQEMAFAAHDLNLYLDTHPNDSNAIRLYNEYNKQEKMLNDAYERKYGPVNLSDNEGLSMTPWTWIKEPWPWNE